MEIIVGLLLAAGRSSRFGADKLLQPLPGGDPIVVRSAKTLVGTTDRSLALIRANNPALKAALQCCGIEVMEVEHANQGMGATIASGVCATPQAAGWVIALGDMPALQPSTVAEVVQALREGASLAAPFYQGARGHPVGFGRSWADTLQGLQGDIGARALLKDHEELLTRLDVQDAGCVLDIDTQEDFLAFVRLGQGS